MTVPRDGKSRGGGKLAEPLLPPRKQASKHRRTTLREASYKLPECVHKRWDESPEFKKSCNQAGLLEVYQAQKRELLETLRSLCARLTIPLEDSLKVSNKLGMLYVRVLTATPSR